MAKGYAVNYYNRPTVIMSEEKYKKSFKEDVEHVEEWSNLEGLIKLLPHLKVIR
ncbi:hypothetical protein [Sporosarcina sp. FSL K6-3457]|uniref:hypothetical protein n=1 Tax=Sporosarcina sp. FSL K6-3457 TaxID=2978204 RepID=UPI0030F5E3A8